MKFKGKKKACCLKTDLRCVLYRFITEKGEIYSRIRQKEIDLG